MRNFALALLMAVPLYGQQLSLVDSVSLIQEKIESSSDEEKLKLLDSLCSLVHFRAEFAYDSIVKQTIDHAEKMHADKLVVKHTIDRIFFLANRLGNPEEAMRIFDDFKSKNWPIADPQLKAGLYMNGGDSYYFSGEIEKAMVAYKKAEENAAKANDSITLSKCMIYRSDALTGVGRYAEAVMLLTKAEEVSEKARDTSRLMLAQHSRANLYGSMSFIKEANEVREDLIELAKKSKHYNLLQSIFYNMAVDYDELEDYQSMIQSLKQAAHYAERSNIPFEKNKILIAMFRVYAKTDSLNKAKAVLDEIQKLPDYSNISADNFNYTAALAFYEYAKGNYQEGIALKEDLMNTNASINVVNQQSIHSFLSKAYEKIGNTKKAYYHYKQYAALTDSINNEQNTKALTYYQTLYETKKRDATIKAQQSEIEFLDVKNKVKGQWMLFGGLGLLLGFIIIYLMRSRKYTRRQKQHQERFSQELIRTQEEERTKVARDLHDSVGQKLMLLTKKIKTFNSDIIDSLAKNTMQELRVISRGLYPSTLERLGITAAIESLVNQIDANTEIFFTSEIANIDGDLSKEDNLHLYRCIQEILNNVVKHSKAKSVFVAVAKKNHAIQALVKDNGVGFQDDQDLSTRMSLGMKTLMERAKMMSSYLQIDSKPNRGTSAKLTIPLK